MPDLTENPLEKAMQGLGDADSRVTPEASSEEDQALDALWDKYEIDGEAAPEAAQEPEGEPEDATPDQEPEASADDAEAPESADDAAPEGEDEELDAAIQALARAGIKKTIRDGMSREDLLETAAHLRKREDDIQRKLDERSQLKQKLAEFEKSRTESEDGEPLSSDPTDATPLVEAAKPFAEALASELGDEGLAAKASEAFAKFGEALMAESSKGSEALQGRLEAQGTVMRQLLNELAWQRLGGRASELNLSAEARASVDAKATKLLAGGEYPDSIQGVYEAYDDAFSVLHGRAEADARKQASNQRQARRSKGSPTTGKQPKGATSAPKDRTQDEIEDDALARIFKEQGL